MPRLNIDTNGQIEIASEDLIGVSAAILGITGSGKSNTASVLVEELLASGFPMTIVDIEGEYWGLKERFEILVAGRGEHADLEVGLDHAATLAELSARRRIPVILDMSEFSQDEMFDFLLPYFKALWLVTTELRQPYQVILEEAHEFVPQGARTPLKEILTRIALRGRKRGLATVLISQRSPKVDKDLLTQAPLMFLHKVIHPVDLRVYQDLIPLPARQVDEIVGNLQSGEAVVLYKNKPIVARIRVRETFHAGATPTLFDAPEPALRKLDEAILAELRAPVPDRSADEPSDQRAGRQPGPDVERRILELQQIVEKLKEENQRLCDQIKNSKPLVGVRGKPKDKPAPGLSLPSGREITPRPDIVLKTESEQEPDPEDEGPHLSELARKRRANEQQRSFDYLVKDILGLRRYQQKMLRFLVEREGRVFTLRDIARGIDISQSTMEKHGDVDLLQLGMIERTGKGVGRRYTSKARAVFERDYPLLDQERLRETLLYKLMKREV